MESLEFQIQCHINDAKLSLRRFKEEIEGKDVVVCMGNTRSGKSTYINYLQGNELQAFQSSKRIYIQKKEFHSPGPVINHGSLSCTKFPTAWKMRADLDAVIIDFPGFGDNRGIASDIVSTLFFNQLKYVQSIRFVLVSDINDIYSDNVQEFTRALEKLEQVVNDSSDWKDCVSVVFTKDCKNYSREDVARLLTKKIVAVREMKVKKGLVRHIVKYTDRIAIFRMPSTEGMVKASDVDCNVQDAIFNTFPVDIDLTKIKFTPSEQTHCVLLDIFQKCNAGMNFSLEIKKLVCRFSDYFNVDKYVFASTEEELSHTKTKLQHALTRITTELAKTFLSVHHVKDSISSIAGLLSEAFEEKLNFILFAEEYSLLDENIKQLLITKYKQCLTKIEFDINNLIKKIDDEFEDRTQQTIQHLLTELASDRNKIVVFGSGMIPLLMKGLKTVGLELPQNLSFEIINMGGMGGALIGGVLTGVAAGSYGMLYYKTNYLRQQIRREQDRS